jgi:four helix bundle protein
LILDFGLPIVDWKEASDLYPDSCMAVPMTPDELKHRTKRFALAIIRLVGALPRNEAARIIGGQMPRSGTSVGANYRAACSARSRAEFTSRLGVTEEEADETFYWLELLEQCGLMKGERIRALMTEANEFVAILTASRKTATGKN